MIAAFLLAFPALFSIVNPPGVAFIWGEVVGPRPVAARRLLAARVALYSLAVMLVALWGGAYLLNFFGISLAALRLAGGAVVALRAWDLLSAPEQHEARKAAQAAPAAPAGPSGEAAGAGDDIAFFPLTLPFTTGPGTISVAVALGAGRPEHDVLGFFAGVTAAALAMAAVIWITYRSADRLTALLSASGRQTAARLSAFILLCIGVQIMITGVVEVMAMHGAK